MVPLTFSCRSHLLYICCLQLSIQSFLGEEDLQRCPAVVSFCTFHVRSQCRHRAYDGTRSSSFVRCSLTNPLTFPTQCWCFWSSDKLESSIELTVDLECHSREQKQKLEGTSWSVVSPQVKPRFCCGLGKFLIKVRHLSASDKFSHWKKVFSTVAFP